jgi:hypothetical protein
MMFLLFVHGELFLIDNIFVNIQMYLVDVFFKRRSAYLWVQTAPLLADLFLYSYEADFIQELLKENEMKLAQSFNFTLRYIDDVLSLNNLF